MTSTASLSEVVVHSDLEAEELSNLDMNYGFAVGLAENSSSFKNPRLSSLEPAFD